MDRLDSVFNPRSIAFFGASNDTGTMGTGQLAVLLMQGFKGPIYPVHPRETEVLGLKAYRSIADVPGPPDLAVMTLPTRVVPGVLDECGRRGVKAVVVVSGGFREVGGEGEPLERRLVEVADEHGIALIGPNCIGVCNFHAGLNTTYFPYLQEPGNVSVISQSGTYSSHIFGYTQRAGIRLSHTASVGNSAVIGLSECLEYFAQDPLTAAIALYIEGIADGEGFMRAARRASAAKPVAALYVGGTAAGARAGMSHTGALAGDDAIYEGMLRQSGVVRANSIEQLLEWSRVMADQPPMRGDRLCVLSMAGGPGASMADSAVRAGLRVPLFSGGLQSRLREILPGTASVLNPVDITYFMDIEAMFNTIPRIIMESGEVDGLVLYGVFGSLLFRTIKEALGDLVDYPTLELSAPLVRVLDRLCGLPREYGMPVLVASFWGCDDDALAYLSDSGVPVFSGPERAVDAMAALHARHVAVSPSPFQGEG